MNTVDLSVFTLIILVTLFIGLICNVFLKNYIEKIFLLVSLLGFCFYSGIGIAITVVSNEYVVKYVVFILIYSAVFTLIMNFDRKKNNPKKIKVFNRISNISVIFGTVYIIIHLLKLIYPEFRLWELFTPNNYTISSSLLFERYEREKNIIFKISEWIIVLTRPFFYIMLYNLRRKPIIFISLLLLPVYTTFVFEQYINRSSIAMWIAIIIIYLYVEKFINKKILIIITIIFSFSMIQASYLLFQIRTGTQIIENTGFFDMLSSLIISEASYPKNYDIASYGYSNLTPYSYILWFIMLPIPNILIGTDAMSLNQIFTYMVRGTAIGDYDFYIVLPSILGEGLMLYGESYYWIHGVFIAIILGVFVNLVKNIPQLKYWLLFIILWLFLGFRGGSQAVLAQLINGSILIVIIYLFTSLIYKKGKY